MSIEDWAPVFKAKIEEIPGLLQVHDYTDLPGSIQVTPSAIILPTGGRVGYGEGVGWEYTDVQLTIYTAMQILPEGLSEAVPFIAAVRNKMAANYKLNKKVDSCGPPEEGNFFDGPGQVEFAGKNHIGIIFRFTVKETIRTEFQFGA